MLCGKCTGRSVCAHAPTRRPQRAPTTVRRHAEREAPASGRGSTAPPRGTAIGHPEGAAQAAGPHPGADHRRHRPRGRRHRPVQRRRRRRRQHHRHQRDHDHDGGRRSGPSRRGRQHHRRDPVPAGRRRRRSAPRVRAGPADVHRPRQGVHGHAGDQRGRHGDRARCRPGARDREQLRRPGSLPLLRRRAVPSDRPGVRGPGGRSRRPARPAPAGPATRSRTSCRPTRRPRTRRDGGDGQQRPRRAAAASSSS